MIWEVFRQEKKGAAFAHAGSVSAPDATFAEAFAREIVLALEQPHDFPDLREFSWPLLAERLLAIIDEVAARAKPDRS